MPGVLSKGEPSEPIEPPPDPEIENAVAAVPTQQVSDGFDPVKFAMDHVFGPDFNPENMNTDGAPDGISTEIKAPFEMLCNVFSLKPEDDIAPYLVAIERIIENLNEMNLYADCEELDLKDLLVDCLWCKHDEIKKGACDILTQICKVEPECREFFTDHRIIFELLSIVDANPDDGFVLKALDALIAILSCNVEGLRIMQSKAGMGILLNTLRRDNEEWNVKIASYFIETCELSAQLPLTLISQEYIPAIVILIAKDRKRSHYYLIKLLTILLEEDYDALEELSKSELDVEVSIRELIESSTGLSALENERNACLQLLQVIDGLEVERPLYDRG